MTIEDAKLLDFIALFLKWNQRISLSAASTGAEVAEHVEDSRQVVRLLSGRARVLDVGSGGGFPVVVAAICLPDSQFTSLEPIHKKHAFLRTAARELDLPNLTPLAQRLEDHVSNDYDAALSRATFDLADWLSLGSSRVRPGGIVIGFEAVARADLPASVVRHPYTVSGKSRALVVLSRP